LILAVPPLESDTVVRIVVVVVAMNDRMMKNVRWWILV
jgi:hypothetical protein